MKIQKMEYIDSLRGIAILLVLTVHSAMLLIPTHVAISEHLRTLIGFGQYGVILFFLVSSYTLFRSLDLRKERNVQYFFLRRFFRIAPLYYLVLGIVFFSSLILHRYLADTLPPITLTNLLLHLFFVNGFSAHTYNSILGVEWTLFVEIWFYLLLPFIYAYRQHIHKIFAFFLVISVLTFGYLQTLDVHGLTYLVIYKSPLVQFFPFFIGCYIYLYETNDVINSFFVRYKYLILASIVGTFLFLSYHALPLLFVLMTGVFTLLFLLVRNNTISILDNIFLQFIGKISYSLYLIHFLVLIIIIEKGGDVFFKNYPIWSIYILFFAITILLSSITYNCIEIPCIKLGGNLIRSLQKGAIH